MAVDIYKKEGCGSRKLYCTTFIFLTSSKYISQFKLAKHKKHHKLSPANENIHSQANIVSVFVKC